MESILNKQEFEVEVLTLETFESKGKVYRMVEVYHQALGILKLFLSDEQPDPKLKQKVPMRLKVMNMDHRLLIRPRLTI